eukprot:931803-Prorocentrum_minimum.AAC.1
MTVQCYLGLLCPCDFGVQSEPPSRTWSDDMEARNDGGDWCSRSRPASGITRTHPASVNALHLGWQQNPSPKTQKLPRPINCCAHACYEYPARPSCSGVE